jgi:hypothetical protein
VRPAGRPAILSLGQELEIVELMQDLSSFVCPLKKKDLVQVACDYIKTNNIRNTLKDDSQCSDWITGFFKR